MWTPERVAAIYEMLAALPPFSGWSLPPADEIEFRVARRLDAHGEHDSKDGVHRIMLSSETHGHLDSVLKTLAHEMIHVAQRVAKEPTTHGRGFDRRAQAIERACGWDWRAL